MYPVLFRIGPLPIHAYGAMLAAGFLVGLYFCRRDARKFGIDPDIISDGAFWVLLLALIGTRVLFILMFPDGFSWSNPVGWFAIWEGGLVFQGAIPPALIFIWYWTRRHKLGFWNTLDLAAPWAALGHAIGRIGCFLNGCCYGSRTDLFLGMAFPRVPFDLTQPARGCPVYLDHVGQHGLDAATELWSYHVHPTQLYSSFGLLALCVTLLTLRKHCRPFQGSTVALYFVFYGVGRFLIEMLRADHNPVHLFGLTDQQLMCLAAIILGIAIWVVLYRIKRSKVNSTSQ